MYIVPVPTCSFSKQVSDKFCTSPICRNAAFICRQCPDQQCSKIHQHNEKLQVMFWSQIKNPVQNLENHLNSDSQEFITHIDTYIKKLINDLQQISSTYLKKIAEYNNNIKLNEQFEQCLNKLRYRAFDDISGAQMRSFSDRIKQNKYIQNLEFIQNIKNKERENLRVILYKINRSIDEYLLIEENQIPKEWSTEDREGLRILNYQIKFKPMIASNYYNRGLFYEEKQLEEKALLDYTKAIQYDSKFINAYLRRAIIYKQSNQCSKALADYDEIIEYDPKNIQAYYQKALIYTNKNQTLALINYSKVIELDPKHAKAYHNRGIIYHNQDQIQKALYDYNNAIKYDPKDEMAYGYRGLIYEKKNMLEEALKNYDQAIQFDKDTNFGYKYRAIIYRRLKMLEQAAQDESRHRNIMKKQL